MPTLLDGRVKYAPGDTLPNGAIVLRQYDREKWGDIVLALRTDNADEPFVSWCVVDDGSTIWGEYYATVEEATRSCHERANFGEPEDQLSALGRIHRLLDRREWDSGTAADIADVVRSAGFQIREPF